MLGISEAHGVQPCQARKENSPTSGHYLILVARGGIDQGRGCLMRKFTYKKASQNYQSHYKPLAQHHKTYGIQSDRVRLTLLSRP